MQAFNIASTLSFYSFVSTSITKAVLLAMQQHVVGKTWLTAGSRPVDPLDVWKLCFVFACGFNIAD